MKSLSSKITVSEGLVQALSKKLELSLEKEYRDQVLAHWVELLSQKKFHAPFAMKTLTLRQTYIEKLNCSTIDQVLERQDELFSLGTAKHYRGEAFTLGHMVLLLNSVFRLVMVGKAISDEAIKELAIMILEDYDWLTFEDLKLCLKRGVKGKYGEIYDRLDVNVIYGWVEKYRTERLAASEERRRKEKKAEEDNGVPMPEDIKADMERIEKEFRAWQKEQKGEFEPFLSKQFEHLKT